MYICNVQIQNIGLGALRRVLEDLGSSRKPIGIIPTYSGTFPAKHAFIPGLSLEGIGDVVWNTLEMFLESLLEHGWEVCLLCLQVCRFGWQGWEFC